MVSGVFTRGTSIIHAVEIFAILLLADDFYRKNMGLFEA
jgi:hypothetical protein